MPLPWKVKPKQEEEKPAGAPMTVTLDESKAVTFESADGNSFLRVAHFDQDGNPVFVTSGVSIDHCAFLQQFFPKEILSIGEGQDLGDGQFGYPITLKTKLT